MTPRAPAPDPLVPVSRDRLTTTVFIAALFHGIVILGVGFSATVARDAPPSLETAATGTRSSDERNDDAAYLGEATQRGSGTTTDRVAARTPLAPPPLRGAADGVDGDAGDATETSPATAPAVDAVIATRAPQRLRVRYFTAADVQADALIARASGPDLPLLLMPVGADAYEQVQLTGRRDRDGVVTPDARASLLAPYLLEWRRRVEQLGTLNFPAAARQNPAASWPVLEVEVAADGTLARANVRRSSGSAALDEAAVAILRLASPFEAFPADLASRYRSLRFAYEWRFEAPEAPPVSP